VNFPESIQASHPRRRVLSGNPPHSRHVYGWVVRLDGPATDAERAWLKSNGFEFCGGKWIRRDT
jgi:hypothetical protein